MIFDFLLPLIGCPPDIVLLLASLVCPFLPFIVLYFLGKPFGWPFVKSSQVDTVTGRIIAYIVVILALVYACYAFMIPQQLMVECGYIY